jgi:hypothetical protein
MPRLMNDSNMVQSQIEGLAKFGFSATRIDSLGSTEYTLVCIAIDVTGSVYGLEGQIRDTLIQIVESCQWLDDKRKKKSPVADKILLRVILFSSSLPNGIEELHGFKVLSEIDPQSYPTFSPSGQTPLFDATYSSIGSSISYGKQLMDSDYLANSINFIITDGCDNTSTVEPQAIKTLSVDAIANEFLESIVNVLIGINTASYSQYLANFVSESGLTNYLDAGDVTPETLAKIAKFVSQSTSSQSQSLGTGGPSQAIALSI